MWKVSGFPSLHRVMFTKSCKHPLLIILFQKWYFTGTSCRVHGSAWGRIKGFKSSEFLQNKASFRQFHSEKNSITTSIEIPFPSR